MVLNQKMLLNNKHAPERGRGDARLSRPAARVHRSKRSSVFSSGESATDSLGSTLEDVRLVPLEKTLQMYQSIHPPLTSEKFKNPAPGKKDGPFI